MLSPSLVAPQRHNAVDNHEVTVAGTPGVACQAEPLPDSQEQNWTQPTRTAEHFTNQEASEWDDELSWGEQNPRHWMDDLDAETRRRLAQIPSGWLRFSTCQPVTGGGCGKICVANDGQLNRQVVIKKINPELLHDRAIRRFLNEARITAQLEHPGIAPVYELGVDDEGLPFYAMKQLQGQTLTESLAAYSKLRAGQAKDRMLHELVQRYLSVCQTAAFAHQHGVIHRDLKPDNIMLGQFGETTVVDWGLARTAKRPDPAKSWAPVGETKSHPIANTPWIDSNGSLTVQGMVMGTAAYMSPEQAQGLNDRLDQRSDVFSLGVILFELLTGRSPFAAATLPKTIENVIRCDRADLQKQLTRSPRGLAWICLRAMSPNPVDRYQSAGDLAHDIETYLAGQPIAGLRESYFEKFDRWASRNRGAFRTLFGVFVFLLLVLSIAASFGLKLSVSHQAEHSEILRASQELQARWEVLQIENAKLRLEMERLQNQQPDLHGIFPENSR